MLVDLALLRHGHEGLELLFGLFVARLAELGVGKALAQFHGGLVEGIDAHEPAGEDRGGLEQHHELAAGAGARVVEGDVQERGVVAAQGHAGALGLGLEQGAEVFAFEELPAFWKACREGRAFGRRLAGHEEAGLVALAVEEHLVDGVLVGHAGGGHGHGAEAVLAEALGPELAEPGAVGGEERLVAEEDEVGVAVLLEAPGPAGEVEGGVADYARRILGQRPGKPGCAVKQGLPVYAEEACRQEADGGERRVAAAEVVRHLEGGQAEGFGLLAQEALDEVRHDHHVLAPGLAQSLLQPVLDDEVLGDGLDGAARLADGDDHGVLGIKALEPLLELEGADVVGNPEALAVVAGHVLARGKGALHGAGAEGGAADAEHEHVPAGAGLFDEFGKIPAQGLDVAHFEKGKEALVEFGGKPCRQLGGARHVGAEMIAAHAAGKGPGPFKIRHG